MTVDDFVSAAALPATFQRWRSHLSAIPASLLRCGTDRVTFN